MARRTGIPELNKVAKRLCKLITAFAPIIRRLYPDNDTLLAALETAQAACHLLEEETAAVIVYGD
jgi:hypothetical protein